MLFSVSSCVEVPALMGTAAEMDIFSPVSLPYVEKSVKDANVSVSAKDLVDPVRIFYLFESMFEDSNLVLDCNFFCITGENLM